MSITKELIKKSCSPTMYKRGGEYFKEGRVHLRKREENRITALIDDEKIFNIEVGFDNEKITGSFCTCPYFQTMHTPCKHIVAAMLQRLTEIEAGGNYADENDKIALQLCNLFAVREEEKEPLLFEFILSINKTPDSRAVYTLSMTVNGKKDRMDGVENFLDSYSHGKEFKIDRSTTYMPDVSEILPAQKEVLDILSGAYLDKCAGVSMYSKASYQIDLGERSAVRLFPLIQKANISVVLDNMKFNAVTEEDDPDILVDISVTDDDIMLGVSDKGLALTDGGEWFLYENIIYHTSKKWQRYFMPIYRALAQENRIQLTFKGENRILFAKHVLPELVGKRGVTSNGIEELVVDEKPRFEIYFDAVGKSIQAVIIAYYGSISIRLKGEEIKSNKVIVRDFEAENLILDEFVDFAYSNATFMIENDERIFRFIKNSVPKLKQYANINYSKSFINMFKTDDLKLSARIGFNEKSDLLEADFQTNLSTEQIVAILNAVKLKKTFYRFNDGRFLDFEDSYSVGMYKLLNSLGFEENDIISGKKEINKYYALYLDALDNVEKKQEFKEYIEKVKNVSVEFEDGLGNVLREYQKVGVTWLKQLSALGFGGILADDMGLGKTLQVLAYIYYEKPLSPTLIVTPSALMYNWQHEIKRFIPNATSLIIDGNVTERGQLVKRMSDYDFIITSYPILRRDISIYEKYEFEYLFIDEAQHIKNAKTMNASAVKRINAKIRFAVTGTPIENSLSELWSVFDFVMPGYLGSLKMFRENYEYPIMRANDTDAAIELRSKIKPFIMRRMKSEVLSELPEKIEETIYADMSSEQRDMYTAFLASAKNETLSILSGGNGRMRILALLMRLRQICCHPSLFDEEYKKDSGKLNLLLELVSNALDGGHRILIFSQFTSMLDIIGKALKEKKISYFYLDGKTPAYDRVWMSERFNGGEKDVFLISLKAGGTGLNLMGADTVIHFDPWWNPAVTDQASDRVYRIGQTKAVQIIKLAARNSIEEKILKLQDAKKHLAEDIVEANGKTLKNLSDEEIIALFE